MQQEPTFFCADCQAPVHVVHPSRARTVVCATCGAQHDLGGAGGQVIAHVTIDTHFSEGLLEIGQVGRLGDRVVEVIGRIRLSNNEAGQLRMWDEWVVITEDGAYLRVREEAGQYAFLLPFLPEGGFHPDWFSVAASGQAIPFEGQLTVVQSCFRSRVLHVEGELTTRVCVGDTVEVMELPGDRGPVLAQGTYDGVNCYVVEPVEDRAMWSFFGYDEMLKTFDALWYARERNEALSGGLAQGAAVLLVCALLGGIFLIGVLASHEPAGEGWARFDFVSGAPPSEEPAGTARLSADSGFYTVDVECSLASRSRGLDLIGIDPNGARHTLATCRQAGSLDGSAFDSLTFRVQTPGEWTIVAAHEPREAGFGRSHVHWQMGWDMGSVWWPLGGVVALLLLGGLCLLLYPITRRMGLTRLERAFEDRRTELALDLRQRHAHRRGRASARWVEGGHR